MIGPLFIANMKKHWVLLLIFFGVLTMYTTMMIAIFDPENLAGLIEMAEMMPPGIMETMGFSSVIIDLNGYIASWLYGLLMLAFPMIYSILLGHKLVAKMVDNSSFAYLLSSPNPRHKIILTQGLYGLSSILVLFVLLYGVGIGMAQMLFPGTLDTYQHLRLHFTTMLVDMTIFMVVFFFSCLFNEGKWSVSFGSGVPIAFLLFRMMANASPDVAFFNKLTPFGYFDPVELVAGGSTLGLNIGYGIIIIVLLMVSVWIFNRKRLPL